MKHERRKKQKAASTSQWNILTKTCGHLHLIILQNVNSQQILGMRKNIIKIFKDIGFTIDLETNLKIGDFLDITFDFNNITYRTNKKPNDLLSYINKSSNHPPQIINRLPKTISEVLY